MISTKIYTIHREGWNEYFELHVSRNTKIMRAHIEELAKDQGWSEAAKDLKDTEGMVHPVISNEDLFALLFLSQEHLGVGVVAHECLHVAMAHERFILRFGMEYGDGLENLEHEERLAYFLTHCIRGVYNALYENGHIPSPKEDV